MIVVGGGAVCLTQAQARTMSLVLTECWQLGNNECLTWRLGELIDSDIPSSRVYSGGTSDKLEFF